MRESRLRNRLSALRKRNYGALLAKAAEHSERRRARSRISLLILCFRTHATWGRNEITAERGLLATPYRMPSHATMPALTQVALDRTAWWSVKISILFVEISI